MNTKAYAAHSATSKLEPWKLDRRDPNPDDVSIKINYCGVCHSDIHFAENDWGMTQYPVVPGHEIIGTVTAVGSDVNNFKVGDTVGVGCLVDSCRSCPSCAQGLENYCLEGFVGTYGGIGKDGQPTYGGYSDKIVVSERFVLKIPEKLDVKSAAPLLCAGITTYSPLRHVNLSKGDTLGVVGMGGLGHIGIKLAKAMGAEVTVFTRSKHKIDEAKRNGADHVVISTDEDQMAAAAGSLNYILDTVPVDHDFNPYLRALKLDGTYIVVGQITPITQPLSAADMIFMRRSVVGSLIGGIPETQEVLDFCAEHDISCDVEMIKMQDINEGYQRMKDSDVKYRFVIDMSSI
ncbi:NAD(P)-dependent alcohol dehydrogenase [Balneola sp. MJW-20]|uniref:NAD(P)-dependent alcohol dehydrogenase n=1 Tax=Gracilimonas aurantiaca TaxID=3234185 RepID=UPI003466939F